MKGRERSVLLFDLDGTLIDSFDGITRCIAHAFAQLDEPGPELAALRDWIGPPLRDSFGEWFGDPMDARIETAVAHYRTRFDCVGWKEHTIYDGIHELINELAARGHRMAVVTAKNEPHAQRIVEHLPFGQHFETVVGATLDTSRSDKTELIAEALERLAAAPGQCTMLGDRRFDIDGARDHGMHAIGISWGYGSAEELARAGADNVVASPSELLKFLAL
ncbi:MAG: HAD hydrolase-like protein [Lysobacterales bacterium]